MRSISFAWTTPAIVTRNKACTRRDENGEGSRRYWDSFKAGELVAAYDRQPQYKGQQIATISLTAKPVYTGDLPEEDYEREGFVYLTSIAAKVDKLDPPTLWRLWHFQAREGKKWWVVRFEIVDLTPYGRGILMGLENAIALKEERAAMNPGLL